MAALIVGPQMRDMVPQDQKPSDRANEVEMQARFLPRRIRGARTMAWIALSLICLWLSGSQVCWAQGTLLFRNFFPVYVYTNATSGYWTNEYRPVLLADGVTRAAGSNYVVELWAVRYFVNAGAPRMESVATTHLLEGDQAGLFRGGSVEVPFVPGGFIALLALKIWDDRTGWNFDTATIRGAVSFENLLGGGTPPTLPHPLYGLPSLCLGDANCGSNSIVLEFGWGWGHPSGLPPRYSGPRSSAAGIASIRRVGNLMRTNTVDYFTYDLTATNGKEYLGQSGTLTFVPGETLTSFTVPVLPDGLDGNLVSVGLQLTNADSMATLGVTTATLNLYDDRPVMRWVDSSELGFRTVEVRGYGYYYLEYTETLSPPHWTSATYEYSGGTTGPDGLGVQTFLSDAWPEGFYRASTIRPSFQQ